MVNEIYLNDQISNYFCFAETRNLGNTETQNLGNSETQKYGISETQKLGISETQKLGNSETWKLGSSETQKHGSPFSAIVFKSCKSLSPDIVQFRSACLRTEIFLRELTLSSTLSSNPKSSHSVDPQFSHKLLFYVH